MFCASACAADALVKLPVIDEQDIRFVTLSINGERLKEWVTSIAQDKHGFIWWGGGGLTRYDGYNLKHYRHDPDDPGSLSDDGVRCLFVDRKGNLWIGTNGGGLDRFDQARDAFIHYRHDPNDVRSLGPRSLSRIYEDRNGTLWLIGDGLDRLDPGSSGFIHYRHNPQDSGSLSDDLTTAVCEDHLGNFWVGTFHGLNKLDRATGRFTRYIHEPQNPHSLGQGIVGTVWEDQEGILWAGVGNLLDALDPKSGNFTHYSFLGEQPGNDALAGFTSHIEVRGGALWIGTIGNGLLRFEPGLKRFIRYKSDPADATSLSDNEVEALFEDSEGIIWAGTQKGISRFLEKPFGFARYQRKGEQPSGLRDNLVWSVQEDRRGYLWIGTRDGLHRLDRKSGQFTVYAHDPKNPSSISYDTPSAVREDSSGTLWVGTYGGGLNRFDPATGRFFAYRHEANNPESLSNDRVLTLLIDRQGVLWVGTGGGGLNRFDRRTGHFRVYRNRPGDLHSLSQDDATRVFEDRQGVLWVATNGGLNRFDRATEQFTVYRHTDEPGSLSSDSVKTIYEDRAGTFWIGTSRGLDRMDRSRGAFVGLGMKDGLPSDTVESILEDGRGDLWLGTHAGISHFNPRDRTFRTYSESDGLAGDDLNPFGAESSCMTRDGEMVFGSKDGVTLFHPDRLSPNPYVPPVVLTDFLLFNKPVGVGSGSPLQKPIWAADALKLNHSQSIFSIEFASLSYADPRKNRYRYRLEKLETQWNEVDSGRRIATYTSLPPGAYRFRVQGSNNDGAWNDRGVNLAITVLPPWWATWWLRTIILVSIAGTVLVAYRYRVRRFRLAAARLEREVAERTRELRVAKDAAEVANRAKSTFLANMSHELRTPLNAILGFSSLLRERGASEQQRHDLDVINRSGEHLLGLINDVLDVAKIEAGQRELEIAPCDLGRLVEDVADMVRARALQKGLALRVETPAAPPYIRTDGARLRQVLINLLDNAVKFTDQGSVTLRLNCQRASDAGEVLLTFEVEDTGEGIATEDQASIFDAFAQAGAARRQDGTGLGLTISRQIIELMGGTIRVESKPGQGSRFLTEIKVEEAQPSDVNLESALSRVTALAAGQPEYRILIVEDQKENCMVLERLLEGAGFRVRVAENGAEGVKEFREWRPHFVWMDLRMPVMDGIEATRRIRACEGGTEVKIAAVTASAYASERRKILSQGLDDYVRKPYHPAEIFECMARHMGVRYDVRGVNAESNAVAITGLMTEGLSALPDDLRTELRDALITLDPKRISEAIEHISQENRLLGLNLAEYTEHSAYSKIFDAIKTKVRSEGSS